MKKNLQVYSRLQNNFVFCDYDWQVVDPISNQSTTNKRDIYYQTYNDVYLWECGFSIGNKLIDAYIAHGIKFTNYCKLGDSSFVLYDARYNIIVVVRDFIGNYPLYYYRSPEKAGSFVFTFSMNALISLKHSTLCTNYAKVVEYIEYDLYRPINNHTFYQHIYRVLPAHLLFINKGDINELSYYSQFNLSKYSLFTDDQLVNRFRKLFIKSVKKLIKPYAIIGATLSGGLDSSSVCSVAQSLQNSPIYTYNFKPKSPEAQEDDYIATVLEKWKPTHQTIESTHAAYDALKKVIAQNGQPFFIFNYTIQLDLIKAARQKNCEVFLSGHWGDQVVSNGFDYIEELADDRDWKNLRKAIAQYFDHPVFIIPPDEFRSSASRKQASRLYAIRLLWRRIKAKKQWTSLPVTIWILAHYFDCTLVDVFRLLWQRISPKQEIFPPKVGTLLYPDILAENDRIVREFPPETMDITRMVNAPLNTAQKRYLTGIFRSNELYEQETYFEIYRQNSMRSAQPFFDAELIELNLQVPLRLKFDEGRRRGTIRRALTDILPDKIVNRITKGLFTSHHIDLFKPLLADFEANTPDNHPIWKIVNRKIFGENIKILQNIQIPDSKKYRLIHPVNRVIQIAVWLDYLENLKRTTQSRQSDQQASEAPENC